MKKTLNILKSVGTWLVVIVAVAMMIFTVSSVMLLDRADRNLFGFRFSIVLSDSMKATDFAAGDLVISQSVDPASLQPGDIITFQSTNPDSYGEMVTHKIRRVDRDQTGMGFVTYGTTTGVDDPTLVRPGLVLGKYVGKLPKLGLFFQFLKTTPGYLCCIFLPFVLLILIQGARSVKLFRQYKREQLEEVEAQRAQLERERQESRAMMEELMRLKAELEARDAPRLRRRSPRRSKRGIYGALR